MSKIVANAKKIQYKNKCEKFLYFVKTKNKKNIFALLARHTDHVTKKSKI